MSKSLRRSLIQRPQNFQGGVREPDVRETVVSLTAAQIITNATAAFATGTGTAEMAIKHRVVTG